EAHSLLASTEPPVVTKIIVVALLKPTVSLDVISLAANSCGYYRGHIEHHTAQECTVHVATQRGRATRRQHRHPSRDQLVAPRRERPCRRPRLLPRSGTDQAPSRDLGHPRAHTGEDTTPSPHHATGCAAHPAIRCSPPGHDFPTLDARWKPLI